MLTEIRINYQKIKDCVSAAELMSLAGKDAKGKEILRELAKDITRATK